MSNNRYGSNPNLMSISPDLNLYELSNINSSILPLCDESTNADCPLLDEEYDENDPTNSSSGSYDEVFEATGFGLWHFLLLLQCGWANASDAIEIMCVSFAIDSMKSLQMSHVQSTWLTVVLFLGMMIGGYLWGTMADSMGRRRIVIFSLAVNGLFGALSALAQTYWLLLLLRFLSGIGAGGSLPVCFSYFSEFQPNSKRGAMISGLATFWMAGNLIAAGIAWLILPDSRNLASHSPFGESWRLFIILCSIPSLTSSFFFILMPESPKYLMRKGKTLEALTVFNRIYRFNNKGKTLPFTKIIPQNSLHNNPSASYMSERSQNHSRSDYKGCQFCLVCKGIRYLILSIAQTIKYQFVTVFGSSVSVRKKSLLMMCVYFSTAFGGYGVTMWTPVLMNRAEKYSGSPCQAHLPNVTVENKTSDTDMYFDVFVGAAAQLPANILTILIIDRVGGKIILLLNLILSGISVLFLWLVSKKLDAIIASAVFQFVITMVWNSLDVITPEMYDTSVRASANGLLTALSRIASILGTVVFGLFIDADCSVPIVTVSVVLLLGAVASFFLPNTKRINLV